MVLEKTKNLYAIYIIVDGIKIIIGGWFKSPFNLKTKHGDHQWMLYFNK